MLENAAESHLSGTCGVGCTLYNDATLLAFFQTRLDKNTPPKKPAMEPTTGDITFKSIKVKSEYPEGPFCKPIRLRS